MSSESLIRHCRYKLIQVPPEAAIITLSAGETADRQNIRRNERDDTDKSRNKRR